MRWLNIEVVSWWLEVHLCQRSGSIDDNDSKASFASRNNTNREAFSRWSNLRVNASSSVLLETKNNLRRLIQGTLGARTLDP